MIDMAEVAREIVADLCERPVPQLERFRLHDALVQHEFELDIEAQGRGYNAMRLAEAIVDRPQNYPDPIPARIAALTKRYGYGDE